MLQWTSRLLWTIWRPSRRTGTINTPKSQSLAGKLGQPQYLIWERPEYRSPSPDHHGCGDVLYPDAPYRSLELPLKSSRLQVHGCFLDGSAICNKMNAQYVPVGRGLGLYSLFLDMKNTPRVFRVLFFTLSTLGVAYQRSTGLHIFYFACLLAAWRLGRGMEHTMAMPRARATATFKVSMPLLVHRARSLRKK